MQAQSGQWQGALKRHCTQFSIQYRTQLYKHWNYDGDNSGRYEVLYMRTYISVNNL
jgi:hypothetical protein